MPRGLTDAESKVFDLVARRFISVFYPDCVFDTTTVEGESAKMPFKVQGKHIVEEGWRVVYKNDKKTADDDEQTKDEERLLPDFRKGESGPHQPRLTKKMTTPPKPYTEATLLRAMETAGKTVDNDELREAMKENGIGRPSTRAAIIQTLFRRRYIKLERKSLYATATGCELIDIIHEELLKSAELTGLWEKKLRDIERQTYDASAFVKEIKEMVTHIVEQVKKDTTWRMVAYTPETVKTKKRSKQ